MDSRESLAIERAEAYAPRPTGSFFMAGVCGGLLALLLLIAGSEFYDWNLIQNLWIAGIVAPAGFLIGLLAYRRLARRSRRARHSERARIDREEDPIAREPSL